MSNVYKHRVLALIKIKRKSNHLVIEDSFACMCKEFTKRHQYILIQAYINVILILDVIFLVHHITIFLTNIDYDCTSGVTK